MRFERRAMMLKSRFRRWVLMAAVASVGAIGYSYAGGAGGARGADGAAAQGSCPFAAIRAALTRTRGATHEAVNTDTALLAPEGALAAAAGDCPEGECLNGAARSGFFEPMTGGDITRQVTKTPDGVMIRISSKKPEVVKMIQARFEPAFARNTPAVTPVETSSDKIARK
jgi:hypothetical protein